MLEKGREMGKPFVSIVLPAYNEEEAIGKVIEDIQNALRGASVSYEALVVDDQSADRTAEIAAAKGARVVRRPIRGGSGAARRTGIMEAQGEIIVMLDADGSYDAGDIPRLLSFFPSTTRSTALGRAKKATSNFSEHLPSGL